MAAESIFKLAIPLFALVGIWPRRCITLANQGDCRKLSFPPYLFFANKRLVNYVIKTEQVPDMDTCEMLCFNEHNCVSCNFENNVRSDDGTHQCELNNSTQQEHEEDFLDTVGFFYHGTDSACDSSHCLNGATCQSGFTNKRYRCLCPTGWTGEHCEQDINECDGGVHDCLRSLASCKNTLGSFNCSCNHGYIGDGKTYCTEAPECYNFTSLTDADRKTSFHLVEPAKNDTNLGPGWFRFQGDAGSMMTTSCPPKDKCNTAATGWLNGTHPEVTDGIVTRQVCFSYNAGCCEWQTQIQVRNCNEYFVYYLHSTPYPEGSLRYCGSD